MSFLRRERDPKVERLSKLALLGGCRESELREIARVVDEVDVRAGRVLMSEGRPGWECFVVGSGRATVTIGGERVGSIEEGAVLGEMSMLGDGLRSATVTADTDMHLFVTDTRGFRELMQHPSIAARVTEEAERRARPDAERL